jgi:hypothetical protein
MKRLFSLTFAKPTGKFILPLSASYSRCPSHEASCEKLVLVSPCYWHSNTSPHIKRRLPQTSTTPSSRSLLHEQRSPRPRRKLPQHY